jgi:hypothetical protein
MINSSAAKVTKKYESSAVYANVQPATTGNLFNVGFPAQGVTNGEREGDSLAIDAIEVRAVMYNSLAAVGVGATDIIRLICLQARASNTLTISNAAAPTTGVLDLGANGVIEIDSHINYDAKNELFHVLMDKSFPVNFLSSDASRLLSFTLKPKVEKVNFSPGSTTSLCGEIYWIAQSLNASANISLEQRLIYHDL